MRTYTRWTLGNLIAALRELPEGAQLVGFYGSVHSYRGYYERNAVSPEEGPYLAVMVADDLEAEIGTYMSGWRGGEYYVSADELVYYAGYEDTGPSIIGLEFDAERDAYVPILLEQDYHF